MNKHHSEALSARIREAINPPRRQTATARILDEVEPLSLLKTFTSEAEVGGVAQVPETPVTRTPPVSHALEGVSVEPSPPSVGATSAITLTPVRGVTAVPNAVLDGLLPQLEPFEQLVYLRLYRLSHGFRNETCLIGLDRLSSVCKISPSSAIRAIRGLESKGLIRRLRAKLGGKMSEIRGNQFWVFRPPVPQTAASSQTPGVSQTPPFPETPIKERDDDDQNRNHHQTSPASEPDPVRRTTGENAEQAHPNGFHHLAKTIGFYTQITKNLWQEGDTAAYLDNAVAEIPLDTLKSVILAVSQRAGSRINSFAYFVKELTSTSNPGTRMARKKALAVIVKRVRESHLGAHNYGTADFVFDVKEACAREGVIFDNDIFNAVCC
jgi:hypothetical protein